MTRDLRKYARRTNFRLILGFIFLLLLVGDGLIYLIYGQGAALMGLLCILGGMIPIVAIIVLFFVMERVVKRANEE